MVIKLSESNGYGVSEMIYDILDGHYSSSTGDINEQYLQDDVYMWLKNEQRLAKEITNTRRKVTAIVWQAFIDLINYYGNEEYGSGYGWKMDQKAVQRWFKKHGADYKEVLAPVVAEVEQLRKERLGKNDDGVHESMNMNESNNPGTIIPKAKAWVKELEKTFKYLSKKYGDDISDIEEAFIDLFDNSGDEIIPWEWDMLIIGAFKEDYETMKEEESDSDEDDEHEKNESVRGGLRESNSYEEFSVTADTWSELIRKLEEATDLEIDSIYRDEPDKFIYGYDTDNNEYEIEVTRYRNGDYEILSDNVNLV